jgi:hypothetical protein
MDIDMQNKTEYIALVSLWLVVRKKFQQKGLFIEPAWAGDAELSGPAIFVSRILAEVYAHLRNKYYDKDDSNNWKVIPLHDFNLLEHAHGIDGPMNCMMTFGFAMEDAESVICIHCPRLRMVPLPFTIRREIEALTFSFNQCAFDFMQEEWASIGLPEFEKELESTDEMDAATFDPWLQVAMASLKVCRAPVVGSEGPWAVFSMQRGMWMAGDEMPVMTDRSIH